MHREIISSIHFYIYISSIKSRIVNNLGPKWTSDI